MVMAKTAEQIVGMFPETSGNLAVQGRREFEQFVSRLQGSPILTIVSRTKPSSRDMNKKGNPLWNKPDKVWLVEKVARTQVQLGIDHDLKVRNAVLGKGNGLDDALAYESGKRAWGEADGCIVRHVNKAGVERTYLRATPMKCLKRVWLDMEGNETDVSGYLKPKKPESRLQSDAGLAQGDQIVHRNYALDSIVAYTYDGVTTVLKD